MTDQTITQQQMDVVKAFRQVFDLMNDGFMKKQYWDYIPFGLAMIYLTTAETEHLKELDDYPISYHIRLFENTYQFVPGIKNEELVMFTPDKMPYDEGFMNKFITALEEGKEDNYVGVLASNVSYVGLKNVLLKRGFSPTDHKVQTIGQIYMLMFDPKRIVEPIHATNEVLYHTIKDLPIKEDDKRLNTHERREKTLLDFLKKHCEYSVTDDCKDLRDSDWPDRLTLWLALSDINPKDFKLDAKMGLINKFFNQQKYVSFSINKRV